MSLSLSRSMTLAAGLATATMGSSLVMADDPTLGLIYKQEKGCSPGYMLYTPLGSIWTYITDLDGNLVHQWTDTDPGGNSVYLLEDGSLLRCADTGAGPGSIIAAGGDGGSIRRFDWDGELLWDFEYSTAAYRLHHDIEPLPNGNVLAIAWEFLTRNEALAEGRDPANLNANQESSLWPLTIVEIEPDGLNGGNIVWKWRIMDHVIQDFDKTKENFGVLADNPRKVDLNAVRDSRADWIHANSVDYDAENDQILISTPFLNEIWIIDHGLTTEEAATEAGDLLYRWGNPQNYDRGTDDDQLNYFSHDARYVPDGYPGAGNITFFNNGNGRPEGPYSEIYEFPPPRNADGGFDVPETGAFGPLSGTVIYVADNPTDYYSSGLSGVERQPNGNTVICKGRGGVFNEVDTNGELIWEYVNPVTSSGPLAQGCEPGNTQNAFRASRYPLDYSGFAGRELVSMGPLELPQCFGDYDCNGVIDGADLTALLAGWATSETDLTGDSTTDGADIAALLNGWGLCSD